MTSKICTPDYPNPIRLFGPHNGHEVFFRTISGKPFTRTGHQMHPAEVLWLSNQEYSLFRIPCAYSVFGYSSAARPSLHLIEQVLKTRCEWSRK